MEYLENNINKEQTIKLISEVIKDPKPFLLCRFGDGEKWIMCEELLPHRVKAMGKCGLHFHTPQEYKIINDSLREDLINCLASADVIGILDPNADNGFHMKYNKEVWSLPMSLVREVRGNKQNLVCDHLIFRSKELGDPYKLGKILGDTPINIVTSNANKLRHHKIDQILGCPVTYTELEYSNAFGNVSIKPDKKNELYYKKEEVIARLESIKEDVVLFGTSAIGKYVGHVLKSKGKVALDVGSILDAWGGNPSRQWYGSTQNHCLIRKPPKK